MQCGVALWRAKNCDKSDFYQPPIVFNLTRAGYDKIDYVALESVKDGIFMSGKYESGMVIYNCPHLVVFANLPPHRDQLSEDRWKIYQIVNGELTQDRDWET